MEKEIMNLHRRKLKYKWLVIDRDGVQNFPLSFDDEHIKRALEVETLMESIQEEDVFGQERKIRNPIFKKGDGIKDYIFRNVTKSALRKYKAVKKQREEQRALDELKGMEIPPVYILGQKLEGK